MSIFEYDEEKHMKSEREWAYKNGHEDGEKEGLKKGEQRLAQLLKFLMDAGRNGDVSRVLSDESYREQLYQENHL